MATQEQADQANRVYSSVKLLLGCEWTYDGGAYAEGGGSEVRSAFFASRKETPEKALERLQSIEKELKIDLGLSLRADEKGKGVGLSLSADFANLPKNRDVADKLENFLKNKKDDPRIGSDGCQVGSINRPAMNMNL